MRPPLVQGDPPMTRINVTPIIDVALVLVIILLFTAPMLSVADLDIDLPQAHARDAEEQTFVSITMGASGEIAVDDVSLPDGEALTATVRQHLAVAGCDDPLVVVRADARLTHAAVNHAMAAARAAGATRLAIAIRQGGQP